MTGGVGAYLIIGAWSFQQVAFWQLDWREYLPNEGIISYEIINLQQIQDVSTKSSFQLTLALYRASTLKGWKAWFYSFLARDILIPPVCCPVQLVSLVMILASPSTWLLISNNSISAPKTRCYSKQRNVPVTAEYNFSINSNIPFWGKCRQLHRFPAMRQTDRRRSRL